MVLSKRKSAEALIVPFFEGEKSLVKGVGPLCALALKSGDFTGKKEEVLIHYPSGRKEKRVVLVGLGKEKEISDEIIRRSYAKALIAIKKKVQSVNVIIPEKQWTRPAAEGILLANYIFDENKSEKEQAVKKIHFIGADTNTLKETEIICKGVCFTRDLIFNNASVTTPTFLGHMAKELEKKDKAIKTTILGDQEIEKEGLGLLQAVSQGASEEPALIIIEYRGAPKEKEITALVGKGVTYDTGGLSLKPTSGMLTMRDDMSGAAAVLGTIHAISNLKLPVNVVGVIGSAENAIGPDSYKIGDVYSGYAGITVEVTNTDAEGRLVLADALSYVQDKYAPTRIIDLATLTGGAVIALGEEASALMSNNDHLTEILIKAGEETYERLWPLPLYEEYKKLLESKVADIKNSGERKASAIQAGIFLQKFIEKNTPWVHLDIAGTAFPDSLKSYQPVQATGVGVRLLTNFLKNLCS